MPARTQLAVQIQRRYYAETAADYDSAHAHESAGDPLSIGFVHAILRMIDARSVLDVGTATGREVRNLRFDLPGVYACGVEPVAALASRAVHSGNVPRGSMLCATGEALPFADESFDAVCEFSVLHHVPDPNAVIREMLRVARKAVFLMDSNRFGQGPLSARLLKLALYKSRLWSAFDYVRTRGKRYRITDGDGLAYSYSVFDSLDLLAGWADRVILIPTGGSKSASWFHPLLDSAAVIVCALRERNLPAVNYLPLFPAEAQPPFSSPPA